MTEAIEQYILQFLLSNPTPQELQAFGPTPAMQAQIHTLLEKNRSGTLTDAESRELDEYVEINHFVTILKARRSNNVPS
jgi:hypothetical protein